MYTVYKHTSPSGKVYIGITKHKPEWRWNHGRGYCRGDQPLFQRAIEKYGWDNIKHDVLYNELTEGEAKAKEIELIALYKSLGLSYNMTLGGDGGRGNKSHLGQKASEETRMKMSASRVGIMAGEKNPNYGKRGEKCVVFGKKGGNHPASKVVYQYDLSGKLIKKWNSLTDAADALSLIVTNITAVCKGKGFTLGGFRWSYSYPYVFSDEERSRREAKRKKLSEIAKEGYRTGKRKPMIGSDNPMSKEYKLKKIEAQKQIAKAKNTSSSNKK